MANGSRGYFRPKEKRCAGLSKGAESAVARYYYYCIDIGKFVTLRSSFSSLGGGADTVVGISSLHNLLYRVYVYRSVGAS